jgi:outer membrane protein assembly factor BamD
MGHMNAYLMSSPGFQLDPDQGVMGKTLGNAVMSDRGLAFVTNRKTFPVDAVPADRFVHRSAGRHGTLNQSQVFPIHGPSLKLFHQRFVRGQGLCSHQQSAGVLVQPVDNAAAGNAGQHRRMIKQSVLQSSVAVPGRRVHDQARGLVDDQDLVVLINHRQRDILTLDGRGLLDFGVQDYLLTAHEPMLRGQNGTIDSGRAAFDPALQAAPGKIRKQLAEDLIKTTTGHGWGNLSGKNAGGIHFYGIDNSRYTATVKTAAPTMPSLVTLFRPAHCVVWLLAFAVLLFGCSTDGRKDKDEYADWTAEQFYTEAKKALTEKRYEKAITLYKTLEIRYPFGKYSTQAQLDKAYALYKNDDPETALADIERFIKLNPTHPNVDYAYYLRGLVNYNRGISFIDRFLPTDSSQRDPGSARDAYREFDELVTKFPNSRYVDDARQRMVSLRNNLAMYEVHVADFYMRRRAYLAAARRCAEILRNYQRTPAVPVALQIMEQAYRKLDMKELADDAARVYAFNYARGVPGQAKDLVYEPSVMERLWNFIGLDK